MGVAVAAVSLLVAAVAVGGTGAGAALEQEQLHSQHLMSQHAISATAAADDGGLVRALFQERARSSKTVAAMRTEAYERGLRRGLAREGE